MQNINLLVKTYFKIAKEIKAVKKFRKRLIKKNKNLS